MHASKSLALTGLSLLATLPTLTAAQSSEDTANSEPTPIMVYIMYDNRRPPELTSTLSPTVTYTGSVLSAAPSATTYSLAILPLEGGFVTQTDMTLVNGPSTYAAWQVYNGSSTYGEFCSVLAAATAEAGPVYDCNVTYLGAFSRTGVETTLLETATNTYGSENRTFLGIPAVITEGAEALQSVATLPPGEYTVAASTTGEEGEESAAAETAASAEGTRATSTGEGAAVETLGNEGAATGRGLTCSVPLLLLGAVGAVIV